MENASKALLIAGGILIGMLVLSLFVYMLRMVSGMKNNEKTLEDSKKNAAWNEQWTAYNKTVIYGNEVVTVMNKAAYNNEEYSDNANYQVNVRVFKGTATTETYTKDEVAEKGTNIFKCTRMEDTNGTGRIDTIEFSFIK